MNIQYITKDVTTVEHGIVLHGCNCQGAMGSGVAWAIRRKWPEVFEKYRALWMKRDAALNGEDLLGITQFVEILDGLVVANGHTQQFYGRDDKRYASVKSITECIEHTFTYAQEHDLPIYMPMIGCGLGGLSWEDEIRAVVENASSNFPEVNIFICDL